MKQERNLTGQIFILDFGLPISLNWYKLRKDTSKVEPKNRKFKNFLRHHTISDLSIYIPKGQDDMYCNFMWKKQFLHERFEVAFIFVKLKQLTVTHKEKFDG